MLKNAPAAAYAPAAVSIKLFPVQKKNHTLSTPGFVKNAVFAAPNANSAQCWYLEKVRANHAAICEC
jgi:hypothetical protein